MKGRPAGSTNLPKIRDYLTQDQIDKLVEKAYYLAMEKNDARMVKLLAEQVFGKAPQTMDVTSGGEIISPIYAGKAK